MKRTYREKMLVIIVMVLGTIAVGHLLMQGRTNAFFRSELAHAGATETVIVRGVSYEVRGGVISAPTRASRGNETTILRVAYAQELARRSPILGIEGTGPTALRENTRTLAHTMSMLADLQTSSSSAALMHSLYPTAFLSALADAEEDRQAFLAVGSDVNEARYESAVSTAIETGSADARAFAGAFKTATVSASTTRFSTFGGTISTDSMTRSIDQIRKRFQETRDRYERRRWCLDSYSFACERGALDVSVPAVPALGTSTDAEARNVRDVLVRATAASFLSKRYEIVLNTSVCMALLPGPYHFLITRPEYVYRFSPTLFINEIYFSSTSRGNGQMLRYLKDVHDISFLPYNPMNFYGCPELGSDIATMRATIASAAIAHKYPQLVPQEREPLLGMILREDDARTYLRAAYAYTGPDNAARSDVIAASLMFTEQSAGLDDMVGQIADIMARDQQQKETGVPLDIDVQTFFLTHSAFPSLFLAQNPAAGETRITLTEPDRANFEKLLDQYSTYSSIKETVPSEKIQHDIRTFNDFESDAPGAVR